MQCVPYEKTCYGLDRIYILLEREWSLYELLNYLSHVVEIADKNAKCHTVIPVHTT